MYSILCCGSVQRTSFLWLHICPNQFTTYGAQRGAVRAKENGIRMATEGNQDATEGIERLRKVRGGHRGAATRSGREACVLIKENGDKRDDDLISRLSSIQSTLHDKQALLKSLDDQILGKCNENEIDKEIEESTEITTQINEWIERIKLFKYSGPKNVVPSNQAEASKTSTPKRPEVQSNIQQATPPFAHLETSLTSETTSNRAFSGVRLPKINLPKFNGDVTKYQHFLQCFKCSIEANETLSDVNKLNYLINSLEGPAYKSLEGLQIIEENYKKAMDILNDRYGKPQRIISAHMQALLKLQTYQNDKTSDLRAIYDKIMVNIRGLESLGISSEKYGSLLIPVIMSRMPSDITLQVARKTSEDIWSIDEIMTIIRQEIEAREVSKGISATDTKGYAKPIRTTPNGTTKTFVANSENPKKGIECYFCKKDHYSNECNEITDPRERKALITAAKRCYNCLRTGHSVKDCRQTRKCHYCHGKHNTALCTSAKRSDNVPETKANISITKPSPKQQEESDQSMDGSTLTTATSREKTNVLLQTARAYVYGEDQEERGIETTVLFDIGSQKSYITEKLKNRLLLKTKGSESINLNTFGSNKYTRQNCDKVQVNLRAGDNVVVINALSFPTLCSPIAARVDVSDYPHLQGLALADTFSSSDKEIGILIGADHYHDIVTGEVIKGSLGPVATSSKLGWLLSGTISSCETETVCSNVVTSFVIEALPPRENGINEVQEIVDSLNQLWKHEASGLSAIDGDENTKKRPLDIQEKEGRYEVSLPWKENIREPLDSDLEMCRSRLTSLYSKLKLKPDLLQQYDDIFKEQLDSGVIERVPPEEEKREGVHFLCHFGVIRSDRETTKLRIVFDGSAKSNKSSLSLNDRLEIGDNHMPLLFDTLIRFRAHPIVLTADIEKAFLQVGIHESDRDNLRFLWFDDTRSDNPNIVQYRYKRLLFGLTCSPALLAETIRHHVEKYSEANPEVVEILNRLYADDLSCGTDDPQKALEIYKRCKEIMKQGGFNLRKWNSNDKTLLKEINGMEGKNETQNVMPKGKVVEDDQTYTQYAIGTPQCKGSSKVLGVSWDSYSDQLTFDVTGIVEFAKTIPATKRSLLKLAAKIFDPLGCLTVFTINLKILFQQLCVDKIGWDEELQGNYRNSYDALINDLQLCNNVCIPRGITLGYNKPIHKVELHGFSDASERAYAAVVYAKIQYESGEIDVRFVSSKSKVAPIRKQSIPRLELLGACLLSDLVNTIRKILNEELKGTLIDTFYWVDSSAVLCWIRNIKPWNQYVRHRVSQILSKSDREQWLHCPGTQNPADLPSRGTYCHFDDNPLWWEGPKFLKEDPVDWPKTPCNTELETNVAMKEKLKVEPHITHAMFSKATEAKNNWSKVIEIERFSDKGKLLRTIAWVYRFINNAKSAIKQETVNKEAVLSVSEINSAENALVKFIQMKNFETEIKYLLLSPSARNNVKTPSYVNQFNLYIDENGIVRCRSRITKAIMPDAGKRPIFLPSKNVYSELLIKDCHEKVFHNGIRDTLNLLRQKYWVLRGREKVKSIVRQCIVCKKIEGLPYKTVFCPDLPQFRVDQDPPFTHVGIDFAGPLIVKRESHIQTNSEFKCYVCLFTCASTRAVHLELVEDLTVESFIRSFRRFSARRGLPATIISDNAKTFKAASKEVKNLLRTPRLKEYFTLKGVQWKFIVELAPFQGGFWERLIRSVKRCLIKTIGRAMLNYNELHTILVEIEGVINARPLTYVYDDNEGVSYPLTPSHLVNGRNLNRLPNDAYFEICNTYESLSKRAKYNHRMLHNFTSVWKNDYLLGLLEAYRPKGKDNPSQNPDINVNDIVVVRNEQVKRAFWSIGKVIGLLNGSDGSIRAARVEVSSDKGKKVLQRSLKHLVPLELCSQRSQVATPEHSRGQPVMQAQSAQPAPPLATQQPPIGNTARLRPRRNAAAIGEIARREGKTSV